MFLHFHSAGGFAGGHRGSLSAGGRKWRGPPLPPPDPHPQSPPRHSPAAIGPASLLPTALPCARLTKGIQCTPPHFLPTPCHHSFQHFQAERDPSQLPAGNSDAHLAAQDLRLAGIAWRALWPRVVPSLNLSVEDRWRVPAAISHGENLAVPHFHPGRLGRVGERAPPFPLPLDLALSRRVWALLGWEEEKRSLTGRSLSPANPTVVSRPSRHLETW